MGRMSNGGDSSVNLTAQPIQTTSVPEGGETGGEGTTLDTSVHTEGGEAGNPTPPVVSPEVEAVKAELAKLAERYKNAERKITQQGEELKSYRKAVPPPEVKDSKAQLDDFVKDPQKAIIAEIERREQEKANILAQQHEVYSANRNIVYSKIPNLDTLKETILVLAKEDGVENANIAMLEETINQEPMLAIAYAKRAELVSKYEKQLKTGKETLTKVAQASKKGAPITSGTGTTSTNRSLSSKEIRGLSNAELDKRLAELTKNG